MKSQFITTPQSIQKCIASIRQDGELVLLIQKLGKLHPSSILVLGNAGKHQCLFVIRHAFNKWTLPIQPVFFNGTIVGQAYHADTIGHLTIGGHAEAKPSVSTISALEPSTEDATTTISLGC